METQRYKQEFEVYFLKKNLFFSFVKLYDTLGIGAASHSLCCVTELRRKEKDKFVRV
jgi:hypothetical protein